MGEAYEAGELSAPLRLADEATPGDTAITPLTEPERPLLPYFSASYPDCLQLKNSNPETAGRIHRGSARVRIAAMAHEGMDHGGMDHGDMGAMCSMNVGRISS